MAISSKYLDAVIREFSRLPGIGPKSAARVTFHLLQLQDNEINHFIQALVNLRDNVYTCQQCGGISDGKICSICNDCTRDHQQICVVEKQKDILILEKTGVFKGYYHVLNGLIAPLDGVGPEDISIDKLIARCEELAVSEVILAINPTVEGDATSLYLANLLKEKNVSVMRLAHGLPVGSDIEYTDSATIAQSLLGRVKI